MGKMGNDLMFENIYSGKRVLVTGHTGFKGSWLASWLLNLGAKVAGYSIDVPTQPSHFETLRLADKIENRLGDIRDREAFHSFVDSFRPEIIFHLAAQSLVRQSYEDPAYTFEVNAMGTLNVLECLRVRPWIKSAVLITSDKCYRNVEWVWGYRETDGLGGEDPYSGSKGCAELMAYSYMHSFFKTPDATAIATTRAGNVIGGGDWAKDRIVPDCMKNWSRGEKVILRNPRSTRPWQHVLEPLSGYLWLGRHLWQRNAHALNTSYNFGPDASVNQPVETLIAALSRHWPKATWQVDDQGAKGRPEANLLKLSCDKALADLSWKAVLNFDETIELTSRWYQTYYQNQESDMWSYTSSQIQKYTQLASERGLPWVK